MSNLFKIFTPSLILKRNVGKKKYNWLGEGVQYPGFKFYPRHKDFEDPPYEPSKLFRVERIKPMIGVPFFQKNILKEFKLDGLKNSYAIIKNIPENNQRLWKIKHLVKIAPVTFPDGFPKEGDKTYLNENGELKIVKRVAIEEKRLELTEDFQNDVKKIDGDTLRRNSRLKWLSGWE